tara:strand:- start:577 stop:948 length:372 start_codon:yes stop_codon:yes gene_type:complete
MSNPKLDMGTVAAGIAALLGPNPYTIGNLASNLLTGQGIPQNLASFTGVNPKAMTPNPQPVINYLANALAQGATGTANIGRDRSGTVISEGGFFRDPTQLGPREMGVGQFRSGGPVSTVDIFG